VGRKRTGSVYEKDGALWYSFQLRSGKRWTKRVPPLPSGKTATREEARAYLEAAVRRYELGLWDPEAPVPETPAPPPVPSVAEYGDRWAKALTHPSAFNEQDFIKLRVERSALGALKLTDVKPRDVAAWVKELRATPSSKGGTLAPNTVRGAYGMLKKMFLAAVFEELIPASPCALPKGVLPKGADKVPGARRGWKSPREDVVELISALEIPQDRRVLHGLLFLAGLRRGEAVIVRWQSYDPTAEPLGRLTIERAWSRRRRVEKTTKTEAVREVPVHPTLAAMLAEWKLSGWEKTFGRKPTPEDLIVPSSALGVRDGATITRQLRADCVRVEATPRRVHGARHTFISLAIDDGARPDVISQITHTRAVRSAFDLYRNESWPTLCGEVAKLKIERRADVLPLFKVASSGGGPIEESATDIATPHRSTNENTMQQDALEDSRSSRTCNSLSREGSQNAAISADSLKRQRSRQEQPDTTDTDSATDSATTGPLTGELWAEDWFERSLLAELGGEAS